MIVFDSFFKPRGSILGGSIIMFLTSFCLFGWNELVLSYDYPQIPLYASIIILLIFAMSMETLYAVKLLFSFLFFILFEFLSFFDTKTTHKMFVLLGQNKNNTKKKSASVLFKC